MSDPLNRKRNKRNKTLFIHRSSSIASNLSSSTQVGSASLLAAGGSVGGGTTGVSEVRKSRGPQAWVAVVNVVLVEGEDLLAMDFEGTSDPYCKFR